MANIFLQLGSKARQLEGFLVWAIDFVGRSHGLPLFAVKVKGCIHGFTW